jgi:amino acid transporter
VYFGHGGGHHGLDLRHDQRPHLDGSTRLLCEGSPAALLPFAGRLNSANVPASSLTLQGLWAAFLVLPHTYDTATKAWGNLYSNLLEYVISAALIFYVLTVAGCSACAIKRPDAPRPYRANGYPWSPPFIFLRLAQFWPYCSPIARLRSGRDC